MRFADTGRLKSFAASLLIALLAAPAAIAQQVIEETTHVEERSWVGKRPVYPDDPPDAQAKPALQPARLEEHPIAEGAPGRVEPHPVAEPERGLVEEHPVPPAEHGRVAEPPAPPPQQARVTEQAPTPRHGRVMVVFEEEIKGVFGIVEQWVNLSRAETVISEKLRNSGYEVVDPQAVKRVITREQALQALNGDPAAAASAGLRYEAPIIIVGKALALSSGNVLGSSMNSIQAEVQAKIYRAADGKLITAHNASATVPHVDVVKGGGIAIERASKELADLLMKDLDKVDLSSAAPARSPIRVTISGLASYRQLAFIRDFLSGNIDGVKGVEQKGFISGMGDLDVVYAGSGINLADKLAFGTFQGFRLEPIAAEGDVITLKVIPTE